ncbi:hypothetical protein BBJ28_00017351 [Nothophytophthora sp. Chile5]|nr:hypothetical protein BBJ28_00017351 [Nothophytophthora sp. Chile5]
MECTARKLNVVKNTRKQERVMLLRAWDDNKDGVELLLQRQRNKSKRGGDEEEKRTKNCMFRLLNVLFSSHFFDAFLESGNQLRRDQLDQGGSTFWCDVSVAFSTSNPEYDDVISDDAVFESVNPAEAISHSAAKLQRMWREVSGNFARAEAGSKVSGQHSNDGQHAATLLAAFPRPILPFCYHFVFL